MHVDFEYHRKEAVRRDGERRNKKMILEYGISDGAVLQRTEFDESETYLKVRFIGNPRCSMGKLSQVSESIWKLSGLATGGPYTVELGDDGSTLRFTDVYVGDVWLLAGQSNMEGAGVMTAEDDAYEKTPSQELRAFYMDRAWRAALPQLHQLWLSDDPAHVECCQRVWGKRAEQENLTIKKLLSGPQRKGVGPGLFFAKELHRLTNGVPQGVIPTAVGGAPIETWTPPEGDEQNYYTAAVKRVRECGGRVRGLFWYQGENCCGSESYARRFYSMREGFREFYGREGALPTVQMQVCHHFLPSYNSVENGDAWSSMRSLQASMAHTEPQLVTVPTIDLELDDCIHLSSASQKKVGVRAANAMHHLLTGEGMGQPELIDVKECPHSYEKSFGSVCVRFKNVTGALSSLGAPSGFLMRDRGGTEKPSMEKFQRIELAGDCAILHTEFTPSELRSKEIWYGWGNDTYCNITDGADRPILAFGPAFLE